MHIKQNKWKEIKCTKCEPAGFMAVCLRTGLAAVRPSRRVCEALVHLNSF